MELLLEQKSSITSLNIPKLSIPTFELKNNYYVVTDGEVYNYYAIKVIDASETSPLIRFDKSPPVLLEGLAVINKKIYLVTVDDLMRRVIRKSREIIREETNGSSTSSRSNTATRSNNSTTTSTGISINTTSTIQRKDKSGTESEIEMEECEIVDSAWSEQIGSLLSFISEKEGEEWEITNTA